MIVQRHRGLPRAVNLSSEMATILWRLFPFIRVNAWQLRVEPPTPQNLGFFGDMVLSVLNGMMNAGGEYDDNLYITAKVKVVERSNFGFSDAPH